MAEQQSLLCTGLYLCRNFKRSTRALLTYSTYQTKPYVLLWRATMTRRRVWRPCSVPPPWSTCLHHSAGVASSDVGMPLYALGCAALAVVSVSAMQPCSVCKALMHDLPNCASLRLCIFTGGKPNLASRQAQL